MRRSESDYQSLFGCRHVDAGQRGSGRKWTDFTEVLGLSCYPAPASQTDAAVNQEGTLENR